MVGPWATGRSRGWVVGLLLGAALLGPGLSRVAAAEREVRDFAILVDGKQAGHYQATITRHDDGTLTLDADSECQVKILLITAYSYSYHGHEAWKEGRLQQFHSNGQEDGKRFVISARAEGGRLLVRANGQDRVCSESAWLSSTWQLPPAKAQCVAAPGTAVPVAVLGCDNGQEIAGHLQYIGQEKLTVAGQEMTCAHYRVMKAVPHDIWYDSSERVVRDVWMSDGHRTEVVLNGIRR